MMLAGLSASVAMGIAIHIIFWQFIFGEERYVKAFLLVILLSFVMAVVGYFFDYPILVGVLPWAFIAIAWIYLRFRDISLPPVFEGQEESEEWDKVQEHFLAHAKCGENGGNMPPTLLLVVSNK